MISLIRTSSSYLTNIILDIIVSMSPEMFESTKRSEILFIFLNHGLAHVVSFQHNNRALEVEG